MMQKLKGFVYHIKGPAVVVGGILAVVYSGLQIYDLLDSRSRRDAIVEVVDQKVSGPGVELFLRNVGGQPAAISGVAFTIEDHEILRERSNYSAGPVEIAAQYSVQFPSSTTDDDVRRVDLRFELPVGSLSALRIDLKLPPVTRPERQSVHRFVTSVVVTYANGEARSKSFEIVLQPAIRNRPFVAPKQLPPRGEGAKKQG